MDSDVLYHWLKSTSEIFQKAFAQVQDQLRDKGIEFRDPNFSGIAFESPNSSYEPTVYVFSLKGIELGRFWFVNKCEEDFTETVTPHLTWVEGVDEIIERFL